MKNENNMNDENKEQIVQPATPLLKQLYSRITFLVGAIIGAVISYVLGHSIAVGIMFGGAASLTITTMFSPNKSKKERWVLGGAMFLFLIVSFVGYLMYRK